MSPALPAVAQRRLARLAAQTPSSRSYEAAALAALDNVGFDFVGEVMGCNAAVLTTSQTGLCGYRSGRATVRLGGELRGRGAVSYPKRAQAAYTTALGRLRDEAAARSADGVVAVRSTVRWLDGELAEIVLTGLAVRARASRRPSQLFLTMCTPVEVSLLLRSGWVPVDVHVAVQSGVRHDDAPTEHIDLIRQDRTLRTSNLAVPGFTELAAAVRASVRATLETQLQSAGADGGIVGDIAVSSRHASCAVLLNRTHRVVQATAWASSLAQFANPETPPSAPTLIPTLIQELAMPSRRRSRTT